MNITLKQMQNGATAMLPMSIAVIPWGILAGSMAIHAGLSITQSIAMSALIFAGAAQLVSLGLVGAGASSFSIIITVILLTSQHLMYALKLRPDIHSQPLAIRLGMGFLLTDEQFALSMSSTQRCIGFLFGSGLCFYLFWVGSSIAGIIFASTLPELHQYPLDFSIVAIFIPIILSLITHPITAIAVAITSLCSVVLLLFKIPHAMLPAAMFGMFCAYQLQRRWGHSE